MNLISPGAVQGYVNQRYTSLTCVFPTRKHILTFLIPPILMACMYLMFGFFAGVVENETIAWYLGLTSYWIIWGIVFPILVIGKQNIKSLIKPKRITRQILLLLAVPVVGALCVKLVPGMSDYTAVNPFIFAMTLSTAFGNGLFEEILWRGMYITLFPDNLLLRLIWPGIWFGLWHYIPVSMHNNELSGLIGMIAGSMIMGLYLGYLTHKTKTLWWSIVAHTIGGLIMVLQY